MYVKTAVELEAVKVKLLEFLKNANNATNVSAISEMDTGTNELFIFNTKVTQTIHLTR